MYQLVFSSAFERQLKKLVRKNPKLKNKASKVLKLLRKNINHPLLKLHKLSGENNWSVSVGHSIRLVIHLEKNKIFCLRVGTHDEVY